MVSKLGYRKDSPYKNRKSLTIDSNHITMKDVEFPLLLVPNNDNPVIAKPGEEYMFNNSQYVKEYRLKNMKYGGQTEELLMAYMAKMKPEEQAEFLERFEELGPQEKKMLLNSLRSQMHEVRNKYEEEDYMEMEDQEMEEYMYGGKKLPEYQWAGGVKVVNGEVYPRKTGVVRNALTGEVISRPAGNPVDPLNVSRQGTTIPRNDDRVFMRTPKSTAPTYRTETGEMMTEGKKAPSYTYTEIPAEDEYVMPNPYSPAKAIQDPFTLGAPLALRGITLPAVSFPRRVKPTSVDPINPGPLPTRPVTPDPVPTRPVPTRPVTTPRAPMPKVPAVPVRGPYNDYQSPDYDFGGGGAGGGWNDTYMAQGDTITVRAPRMPIMEAETPAKTTKSGFRYQETPKAEQSPGSYTVQSGDSLSAIARRYNTTVEELARLNNISNPSVIRRGTQLTLPEMKQGGIYIDPAKRGTFKAQATRMDMGVQEAASKILSNKEDYSPAMVKKANFARNAASWKKEDGGMIEYKMGGELPEYQPGGMAPRAAITDTNRPLNPIRPLGMNEKTLTPEQSRDVAAFVSRGMSRAEAVDLVLSDKVVLPPPGVRGGPGTLALVGGASAMTARPAATTKAGREVEALTRSVTDALGATTRAARPAKRAMPSKLPPASGANPMSLRSPGPGTMAAYSTSSLAGATMASTTRGRQAREDQVDLARQYLGNLQTGMVDSESVRPEAQVTGWGVAAPPMVPKVTYTAQGPTATVTASRLPARSFSTTSTNTRPATSASQPMTGDTYTIKSGDTLSQIARKAGVSVEELAALNNIKNVNMIRAGSTLRLRPQQAMQTMQAPAPERAPVVPLTPLQPLNTFGPKTKVTLQPNSLILKGLEADLPQARENVSRAMAQEPTKKRRFSNRRTR